MSSFAAALLAFGYGRWNFTREGDDVRVERKP